MNIKKKKNSFFRPSLFLLEDRITPTTNPLGYVEPNLITANPSTKVLDITYTAHVSTQPLETLTSSAVPTTGFLTYSWIINDGFNSVYNSATSTYQPSVLTTGDTYPAPTLKVNRGDTLRVTLLNDLEGQAFEALQIPATQVYVDGVVTQPPNLTEMPLNNHTHGLHISPNYSSDNVLLTMPAGQGFVYEYKIDQAQPDGLYWIHPHNHMYSTEQVARGLSYMLIVGTPDSSISQLAALPERTMALQAQQVVAASGSTPQSLQGGGNQAGNQLTINGLVNPVITARPNQTEVWNIANMTSGLTSQFTLKNTTSNTFQDIVVVAQDGIAYNNPVIITAAQQAGGTFLVLGTGGRYSILVTAPAVAGQSVRLQMNSQNNAAINNLYNVTMTSSGAPVTPLSPPITTSTTLTTTGYQAFVNLSTATVDENRTVTFLIDPNPQGNGLNSQFQINGEVFPNPQISQPRLNDVEEWTLINNSKVPHPFHYHVNDIQVMSMFVPSNTKNAGLVTVTTPQQWYQDVVLVPAAQVDSNGTVIAPGRVVIRIKNLDFTGSFVYHCHILAHEDRGMMSLNTVQPETPIYVTGAGQGGGPAVNVYSGIDNSVLASFFAFEEDFTGGVQTAVADVNNDGISDVIVGAGAGGGPRVQVFNGATNFTTTLFDFFAFSTAFSGGVSVAGGDFNADGFADIVVGAGPGGGPQVSIFDGQTGNILTQFFAYDQSFRGGVTVAVGDVDGSSFNSVVTGAGAGGGPNVRTFRNSRFFDIDAARILPGNQSISMNQTSSFFAYETSYTGGVQVAVGLNSGTPFGGFYRILTGTLTAGPEVTIWQAMESEDMTTMDTPDVMFEKVADFFAFDSNLTTGVRVGSVAVSNGSDFLAATGSGTSTVVKRFSLLPGASQPTLEEEFSPYSPLFDGGANLGGTY
ncbi:MAG: multicopper oxidase domain-containing protein [Planctomycetota bacterium]